MEDHLPENLLLTKSERRRRYILPVLILGSLVAFGFSGGLGSAREALGNIFGQGDSGLAEVIKVSEFEPDLSELEADRVISGTVESEAMVSGKVNINTADVAELQRIKGVGPVMASRIVKYREEHGLFNSVDDMKQVSGIGDKNFLEMQEQITIGR